MHVLLHPRAGLHGLAPLPAASCPSCFDSKLSAEETPSPAAKRAFLLVGLCERPGQTGGRRCGEKKGETTCNANSYPETNYLQKKNFGSAQIKEIDVHVNDTTAMPGFGWPRQGLMRSFCLLILHKEIA